MSTTIFDAYPYFDLGTFSISYVQGLEKQVKDLKDLVEARRKRLSEQQDQITSLRRDLDACREERNALRTKLEAIRFHSTRAGALIAEK